MFGLSGRKGIVAPGADADIVIYDPERTARAVRQHPPHERRLLMLRGHCEVQGGSDIVLSRGKVVVENGEYKGARGMAASSSARAPANT